MENHTPDQFYPLLNNSELHTQKLGQILGVFYASNQKYFTVEQLREATSLSVVEIERALLLLYKLGDIDVAKDTVNENHFFVNIEGSIKHIKANVKQHKELLNTLEIIMNKRNNANEQLNDFIKDTIVFNSEVLDYICLKLKEHFNYKNI